MASSPTVHALADSEAFCDARLRGGAGKCCATIRGSGGPVLLLVTLCHASLLTCTGDDAAPAVGDRHGGARYGDSYVTGSSDSAQEILLRGRAGPSGELAGWGREGQDQARRPGARGAYGYDPLKVLQGLEKVEGQEWLQRSHGADAWREIQGDASLRTGSGGRRERRAVQCADCGPRCISTKVAKPMNGECVGPTPVEFYEGEEVKAGQLLWRAQYRRMRVCVQNEGQANRRSGAREKGLQQMAPSLLDLSVADAQDYCRSFWQDLKEPPTFYHTCNDPLFTEEAQMKGYTLDDFDANHRDTFKRAVAAAMMNLKQNNSELVVTSENVVIARTFEGASCKSTLNVTLQNNPCECKVLNSYEMDCPAICCRNELRDDDAGIRVQFRIVGQYSYNSTEEVDQILFSRDVLGLEVEKEFGKITGAFPQVALSSGRDSTPCGGPNDKTTCLMGNVCRRITERKSYTNFVTRDWWIRTDKRWYGGTRPAFPKVREWYCDYDPRLFVGKVRIGQIGYAPFYLRNSNAQVKSECDYIDEEIGVKSGLGSLAGEIKEEASKLDPDRHCLGINQTNPVPADCCGFCFLSNIHLSRLFNCTGMQDILKNDEAIKVLSEFCLKTRLCLEERPCFGEPVKMDPLNRGCQTPYVDGRPLKPGERACGYKWACDLRIPSIRLRIGYYTNDTSIFDPPEPEQFYVMGAGVAVVLVLIVLCCGGCIFMIYRRWRFIRDKKEKKRRKEQLKFLRKREARTSNDPVFDFSYGE